MPSHFVSECFCLHRFDREIKNIIRIFSFCLFYLSLFQRAQSAGKKCQHTRDSNLLWSAICTIQLRYHIFVSRPKSNCLLKLISPAIVLPVVLQPIASPSDKWKCCCRPGHRQQCELILVAVSFNPFATFALQTIWNVHQSNLNWLEESVVPFWNLYRRKSVAKTISALQIMREWNSKREWLWLLASTTAESCFQSNEHFAWQNVDGNRFECWNAIERMLKNVRRRPLIRWHEQGIKWDDACMQLFNAKHA